MITLLDEPTGLKTGQRVRFIGADSFCLGVTKGQLMTVREPRRGNIGYETLDYHHRMSNGHEYVWCKDDKSYDKLVRREDLEPV